MSSIWIGISFPNSGKFFVMVPLKIFSVPLKRDLPSMSTACKFGLSRVCILKFPLVTYYYFILVLVGCPVPPFHLQAQIFYPLPASTDETCHNFIWCTMLFISSISGFFLQCFCLFVEIFFHITHRIPYFVQLSMSLHIKSILWVLWDFV